MPSGAPFLVVRPDGPYPCARRRPWSFFTSAPRTDFFRAERRSRRRIEYFLLLGVGGAVGRSGPVPGPCPNGGIDDDAISRARFTIPGIWRIRLSPGQTFPK